VSSVERLVNMQKTSDPRMTETVALDITPTGSELSSLETLASSVSADIGLDSVDEESANVIAFSQGSTFAEVMDGRSSIDAIPPTTPGGTRKSPRKFSVTAIATSTAGEEKKLSLVQESILADIDPNEPISPSITASEKLDRSSKSAKKLSKIILTTNLSTKSSSRPETPSEAAPILHFVVENRKASTSLAPVYLQNIIPATPGIEPTTVAFDITSSLATLGSYSSSENDAVRVNETETSQYSMMPTISTADQTPSMDRNTWSAPIAETAEMMSSRTESRPSRPKSSLANRENSTMPRSKFPVPLAAAALTPKPKGNYEFLDPMAASSSAQNIMDRVSNRISKNRISVSARSSSNFPDPMSALRSNFSDPVSTANSSCGSGNFSESPSPFDDQSWEAQQNSFSGSSNFPDPIAAVLGAHNTSEPNNYLARKRTSARTFFTGKLNIKSGENGRDDLKSPIEAQTSNPQLCDTHAILPELYENDISIVRLSLSLNEEVGPLRLRCMDILRDVSVTQLGKIFSSLKISVGKESISDIFKKKKKRGDGKMKKKLKEAMNKGLFVFNNIQSMKISR
jgi:hypothetical protein